MDNIPVSKVNEPNPDFLMTDEQAVAVLKVIRMGNMKSGGDILNKVISDHALNKVIKALERPLGEWIYEGVCSICGERCDYHLSGTIWIDRPANFCPNCGARMGGDT